MKKLIFALFSAWCICVPKGYAQTDTCITHLKDAANNYDQGYYDDAIEMLNRTVRNCPLDKADRIQAYKLLIMCYLSVDNLEAADQAAVQVMKINPNYTPDKFKDDPRLTSVFKKFRPMPTFAAGIWGGINKPFEKTINQYSVVYQNGQAPASYTTKTGFQLGLQAEHKAYKNFWVELGFSYRRSSYEHLLNDVIGIDIHYSEKLTYVDFPLSVKYYLPLRRVRPYVQAGTYFSLLSNALSTTTGGDQKDIINRIALRNTYQTGYFGSAGVSYNITNFLLFADFRYIIFPDNVNKPGTRYDDEVNLFKYYYLDDDFKLNNMQINVGVSFILRYRNERTNETATKK